MGGWLARLKTSPGTRVGEPSKAPAGGFVGSVASPVGQIPKNEGAQNPGFVGFVAYAPGTFSKNETAGGYSVGFVASPQAHIQKIEGGGKPAQATALTAREEDTFTDRLARFTDKGLSTDDAELMAAKLVIRDREQDDRGLCLECAHLHGYSRWSCGNWRRAGVARHGVARDLVLTLQRCTARTAR